MLDSMSCDFSVANPRFQEEYIYLDLKYNYIRYKPPDFLDLGKGPEFHLEAMIFNDNGVSSEEVYQVFPCSGIIAREKTYS